MDAARARFSEVYTAAHAHVWAYAARRVGAAAAEDVAAETFAIAWRKFDSLPDEPLPWLYGVARNVVLRQRAVDHRQDEVRTAMVRERPSVETATGESNADLWEAWERLKDGEREVLALTVWEELKVREAAAVLGVPAPVFSVRLHRARKRLEQLLTAHPAPPQAAARSEIA